MPGFASTRRRERREGRIPEAPIAACASTEDLTSAVLRPAALSGIGDSVGIRMLSPCWAVARSEVVRHGTKLVPCRRAVFNRQLLRWSVESVELEPAHALSGGNVCWESRNPRGGGQHGEARRSGDCRSLDANEGFRVRTAASARVLRTSTSTIRGPENRGRRARVGVAGTGREVWPRSRTNPIAGPRRHDGSGRQTGTSRRVPSPGGKTMLSAYRSSAEASGPHPFMAADSSREVSFQGDRLGRWILSRTAAHPWALHVRATDGFGHARVRIRDIYCHS
jgi:hypothetical protein